jgi:hypothetical protein
MNITLTAAFLVALVTPVMAGAKDVTLTPGKFTTDGKAATQLLSAKNSGEQIFMLVVECGFLKDAQLVGTGQERSLNVDTGQTAYLKVTASDAAGADHADCRVVGAMTESSLPKVSEPVKRTPGAEFKPDMFLNPPPKKH